MRGRPRCSAFVIFLCAVACGQADGFGPRRDADLGQQSAALVADGHFAASPLTDWNTDIWLNAGAGLAQVPPMSVADLALSPANPNDPNTNFYTNTHMLSGAAGSLVPELLSAAASLKLPYSGTSCVAINLNGNNKRGSSLSQTFSFSSGDIDPTDHKLRVRAIVAPVVTTIDSHTAVQASYVLIRMDNASRSVANLAQYYVHANQEGLPWQTDSGAQYYGWQVAELTPSILSVAPGDQLNLQLWAVGCSKGAHRGTGFIDAIGGAALGGTSVVTYGPEVVRAGGNAHYDVRVRQENVSTVTSTPLFLALPANTTLVRFVPPADWNCITPAIGSGGNITCSLPPMTAGTHLTASLDVAVAASVTDANNIVLGNYSVSSAGKQTLLGPHVVSSVATDANALCNLAIDVKEHVSAATARSAELIVTIRNIGEKDVKRARIQDVAGTGLTPEEWTCVAGAGASCGGGSEQSGTGALSLSANFAVGASMVCTVQLDKTASEGGATYGAAVSPGGGMTDSTMHDSEAVTLVSLGYIGGTAAGDGNALLPLGAACYGDTQCDSMWCTDGVCCDALCDGPCVACNVSGNAGTCTPLDATAPRLGHPTCGPYLCAAGQCQSACDSNAQCIAGTYCDNHVCRPTRGVCTFDADCPVGLLCTPAHTCESVATTDPNHPNWILKGSGCRHGPLDGGGLAAGLLAWAATRRRRRGARGTQAVSALLLLFALAPLAHAQDSANVPTNHFAPLGGAQDVYGVASPSVDAPLDVSLKLWGNYAQSPLRIVTATQPTVRQDIVHNQATLDVTGSVALPLRLELGVALPVVLQKSQGAAFASDALSKHHLQVALGDLRLTPKLGLLKSDHVRLGLAVPIGVPTGRRDRFISLGGASFTPMALLEIGRMQHLRVVLNAGAVLRPARRIGDMRIRHAMTWSGALVVPWHVGASAVMSASAALFGESNLRKHTRAATPLEIVGGLGFFFRSGFSIDVGAGGGLTNGYGAPRWRVLAALGWTSRNRQVRAPEVPQNPLSPPVVASDVPSPVSEAPSDRDQDGVPDEQDACPDVPGDAHGQPPGCPAKKDLAPLLSAIKLVTFATGSSVIEGENAQMLEHVRQMMEAHAELRLGIAGHTDDSGRPAANMALSKSRARAAARWLEGHGIASTRLEARGFGQTRPIDKRHTAAARAKNRRVAFVILRPVAPVAP